MTFNNIAHMSPELRAQWIDENPEEWRRLCAEHNQRKLDALLYARPESEKRRIIR